MLTSTSHKPRADDAGISLMEMLIVLAIIALGTGITFTYFRGDGDARRVMESAQLLKSDLVRARQAALEQGAFVHVNFVQGNKYQIAALNLQRTTPPSIMLHASGSKVTFAPDGWSQFDAIAVSNRTTRKLISASPITGRIEISNDVD